MTIQERAAAVPAVPVGLPEMTSQTFAIRKLEAFCYRYPLSTPVVTSFGRMLNRPAVFVRVGSRFLSFLPEGEPDDGQ